MTSRHVALLRGVNNIGMARRVSMADLRALFEELGFRDVRTVLNSGNVIFSAPDTTRDSICTRIEKALASKLGLAVSVIVLSGSEVVAAVHNNPLAKVATNPSHLLVVVLREQSDRERLKPLLKERWAPERLAIGKRVAYLWCAKGVGESQLWPAADRALGRTGTARNIRTMTKLMALVRESTQSNGIAVFPR
ncbi:MAG TPA: DUF1697 domain-containing protein [Candidatus Eisenbacteria bacterium]|nr:DUF1697 domain-containing protein [Candidatus Eisenbacteria bacterium]